MPRPKKRRFVSGYPTIDAFSPKGMPETGEVTLSVEGLEAIRLSDFEGLDQEKAAMIMDVSRQTFGRILREARYIVAEALVTGKTLHVTGGTYETRGGNRGCRRRRRGQGGVSMPNRDGTGPGSGGKGRGQGQGKGQGGCGTPKGNCGGKGQGRGQGQGKGGGSGSGRGAGSRQNGGSQ